MLEEKPVQDVLAVLRLDDGIFDRAGIAAGGLVPLAVVAADVPALDLHDSDAGAGQVMIGSASCSLARSIIATECSRAASSGSWSRSTSQTRRSAVRPWPNSGCGG